MSKLLFEEKDDNFIKCLACEHYCKIPLEKTGICGVRMNDGGKLRLLVRGKVVAAHVDPIEKKPLYNFLPGSKSFSIGTYGCNFRCSNCQNFGISQISGHKGDVDIYEGIDWGKTLKPEDAISKAKTLGCRSIAYTYNEPTIWIEYALEIMKLAHRSGLYNVWVSNGYMSGEVLDEIIPYLDAINIDIKSYENEFYREVCGATIKPVLRNCQRIKEEGVHLEITTLIIPTLSDNEEMLRDIAHFIKKDLGKDTPWHLSAFSGAISWKLQEVPNTSEEKLKVAHTIGKEEGLEYVYAGNILDKNLSSTSCPDCGKQVIDRSGYKVDNFLEEGKCPACDTKIIEVYN